MAFRELASMVRKGGLSRRTASQRSLELRETCFGFPMDGDGGYWRSRIQGVRRSGKGGKFSTSGQLTYPNE